MQKFYKNLSIWLIIALGVLLLLHYCKQSPDRYQAIPYTEFLKKVESGLLSKVTTINNTILWESSDGSLFKTVVPQSNSALDLLMRKNVLVRAEEPPQPPWFLQTLFSWLPFLLFAILWFFYFQKGSGTGGGGGGRALAFGKSRARLIIPPVGRRRANR